MNAMNIHHANLFVKDSNPGKPRHRRSFARLCALLLLPCLTLAPASAQVLVDEDFSSGTPGGMPAGWSNAAGSSWELSDPLGSLVHDSIGGTAVAVTEPNAPWTDQPPFPRPPVWPPALSTAFTQKANS